MYEYAHGSTLVQPSQRQRAPQARRMESFESSTWDANQPSTERAVSRQSSEMFDFDLATAFDRPRQTIRAALSGALRKSDASVRLGSSLLEAGVVHGAGAVSAMATTLEKMFNTTTQEVTSSIKDDVLVQASSSPMSICITTTLCNAETPSFDD